MNILITGINGFLGTNLAKSLNSYNLFGLGRNSSFLGHIPIYNSSDLEKLDVKFDLVIICHAAIVSGSINIANDELYNVNVSLTKRVVEKYRESLIIYISTTSIYQADGAVNTETSKINPQSEYAMSKLWAEKVVTTLNNKSIILRISSMFGEGMKENTLIPNYVNQALKNKKIHVWGNGSRVQNYIHVSDVVKYISAIIDNREKLYGKIILGVSKQQYSNLEMANEISVFTNAEINFVGKDNSKSFYYNNDYTTNLLNWEPETNVQIGLQKYIEWKRKKY